MGIYDCGNEFDEDLDQVGGQKQEGEPSNRDEFRSNPLMDPSFQEPYIP